MTVAVDVFACDETVDESPNTLLGFAGFGSTELETLDSVYAVLFVTDADSRSPPHDSFTIVALVYARIYFLIASSLSCFSSSVISSIGLVSGLDSSYELTAGVWFSPLISSAIL